MCIATVWKRNAQSKSAARRNKPANRFLKVVDEGKVGEKWQNVLDLDRVRLANKGYSALYVALLLDDVPRYLKPQALP
jgi:hypothetical protein